MPLDYRSTALLILCLMLGPDLVLAQLSGSYSIGPASDYATITEAVDSLMSQGTSAPVTFGIKSGTYDEQVTIGTFNRTGLATDPVTFEPAPSASVTWRYSAAGVSTNWVVKLDSTSHIEFSGINFAASEPTDTYGRIVVMERQSNSIAIRDCSLIGHATISSNLGSLVYVNASPPVADDLIFERNQFTLGFRGIELANWAATGISIYGNSFDNQFDAAIYLEDHRTVAVIDSNFVDDASFSDANFTGIYAEGSFSITRNTLRIQKAFGIKVLRFVVGAAAPRRIANNMVSMTGTNVIFGIQVESDSTEVYHNTVRIAKHGNGIARPLFVSAGQGADVRNNILIHYGGPNAYVALEAEDAASIAISDYNILHSTGTHFAKWDGVKYAGADIGDFRIATGMDLFTYISDVAFVDTVTTHNLHLAAPSDTVINNVAPRVAGISQDIDGDARGVYTVFRGADAGIEQPPLDNVDQLSGFYTVGGSSPDFTTPGLAILHLNLRGVKGPVTFRVRAGSYAVHNNIKFERFGAPSAPVIFRASSLVNPPSFSYGATADENNWIIKLIDADIVRFLNIDFVANGTPPYGRALVLDGDVDDLNLRLCSLTGLAGETSIKAALVYGNDFGQDRGLFQKTDFVGGSYGVYLTSTGVGTRGDGTTITENYFNDQAVGGIYVNHRDTEVSQDTVVSTRSSVVGIEMNLTSVPIVERNSVQLTGSDATGILMWHSTGSVSDKSPIRNNFVSSSSIGLKLETDAALHAIFNNTIRADSVALLVANDSGSGNEILNNILINTGSGPAMIVESAADIDTTDFNVFDNNSGGLVRWAGSPYPSLATYQAAASQDANSISKTVSFVNSAVNDLHLSGGSDGDSDLIGTVLTSVALDIDGDLRSGLLPYRGADEASAFTTSLGMTVFLEGPFSGGSMTTTLNTAGHLDSDALVHPYGGPPWNYPGTESVAAGFFASNPTVVDWVYLKLYTGSVPSVTAVDSAVGLVLSNSAVVRHDDINESLRFNVPSGSYHVGVFHRNHLGIISSTAANLAVPSPFYHFIFDGAAYTSGPAPMRDLGGGNFGMFAGDANSDGQATANDFNSWLVDTKAAATGYLATDFNMDGQATVGDFNLWLANTKAAATSQAP